jgi:hypothetical protein
MSTLKKFGKQEGDAEQRGCWYKQAGSTGRSDEAKKKR